jgi:nucleotide-binding universal stress UspA family protein
MNTIIGIDGSESSFEALVQACQILSPDRDRLTLYCAVPEVQFAMPTDHKIAERGRMALSDLILTRATAHVPEVWQTRVQRVVGSDEPSCGILKTARELAADLIVVGTRGLGGLGRLLIGSVSRKVIRAAAVPVLVVRKRSRDKIAKGLHVLLACESLLTGRQLAAALSRFTWPGGTVGEVFHAIPSIFGSAIPEWLDAEARGPDVEEMVKRWVRDHDQGLATAVAEMETLCHELPRCFQPLNSTVVEGTADVEILKAAHRQGSDLIVIGAKASTPLRRFVGGSTYESVLNHAPCSVLVVHHS